MGVARQNPEFITDICLCGKKFKGQNGRHEFNLHCMECKDQKAYRGAQP